MTTEPQSNTRVDDEQIPMTAAPYEGGLPTLWLRPHRITKPPRKAGLRELPYTTRGRDVERAHIARAFENMPISIHLITGAPGSGKTALLHAVGAHARQRGCNVVTLDDGAFTTNASLANALSGRRSEDPATPTQIVESASADAQVKPWRMGVGAGVGQQHTRDDSGHEVWRDALAATVRLNPEKGVVILLDEVQDLRDFRKGDEDYKRIKALLKQVHAGRKMRTGASRYPIMMVCAGLLNAADVLAEHYGLSRLVGNKIVRLGPLGEESCRQIMADHLTAEVTTGVPLAAVPPATVDEVIELCGGYAHHIVNAAAAAQRIAYQAGELGQEELDSAQCAELIAETISGRNDLYNLRITTGVDDRMLRTAEILAKATETWGPQLPAERTEQVLATIAQESGGDGQQLRRELARKGILEERNNESGFRTHAPQVGDQPHFTFGVHSLVTYLLHRRQGTDGYQEKMALLTAEVERLLPLRPDSIKVPAWQWDDRKKLAKIDPLPSQTPVIRWPVASGPAATMRDDVREAVKKAVKGKGKRKDQRDDEE